MPVQKGQERAGAINTAAATMRPSRSISGNRQVQQPCFPCHALFAHTECPYSMCSWNLDSAISAVAVLNTRALVATFVQCPTSSSIHNVTAGTRNWRHVCPTSIRQTPRPGARPDRSTVHLETTSLAADPAPGALNPTRHASGGHHNVANTRHKLSTCHHQDLCLTYM